jgi:predicted transglutaminase-like cysteine proteinase
MKWSRPLALCAPALALQFTGAPAHASAAMLFSLPLASVSGLAAAPCPDDAPTAAFAASKSSALLGGAPSRLELISMRQAIGRKVEPAAGGQRCDRFALRPASRASRPGEFLASARLPLGRTSFDAQWNKVSRSALPARAVASIGAGKPGMAMLSAVNAWANARIRYREDRDLYGRADYWATASATLRRGAGDCEDIAVFKMQALAALGVPRADMYLTIARDLVRNADHAVLVVKADGRHWLLDNTTDTPLDASTSHDYRPIMSFSTSGKWLHGYARDEAAPLLIAAR